MPSNEEKLAALIDRLEATTSRLEKLSPASSTPAAKASTSSGVTSVVISEYENLQSGPLQKFVSLSESVGGLIKEQGLLVQKAFEIQHQLIQLASNSKKPTDQATLQELLKPLQIALEQIQSIREKNRPSPLFNLLSTVSDGIPALGWVAVDLTPAPYIGEMKDAATFYSNRVIKEFKDKDKLYVDWVNSFVALLVDLQAYVKKWHTTGLAWNPKGGDPKAGAAAAVASVPTPVKPSATPSQAPKPAALFADLNKQGLTANLRKVDKNEMTHKNPELRASGVVKVAESTTSYSTPVVKAATAKPPKTELQGLKWVVENHVNNNDIVIDKTDLKYTVYIYNCTNSTIKINGKVNAITLDNCKKTGLVLQSAVSSVDIVNCKSSQVQILGKAPTVAIDKTDGLQLYLSDECQDIDILSAKSSEMNVLFQEKSGGDFVEKAVVEQFKTKIVNGALVTTPIEHKG